MQNFQGKVVKRKVVDTDPRIRHNFTFYLWKRLIKTSSKSTRNDTESKTI